MLNKDTCIICKKSCYNYDSKILTNGYLYHTECFNAMISSIQEIRNRVQELNKQLLDAKTKLRETESFIYKIKSFWGGESIDNNFYKNRINTIQLQKKAAEEEISPIYAKITSLYDYWPETPPDWDERKELARNQAGNICQKCSRSGNIEKHVHHKTPVSRGGSHRIENLEYLCVRCHSKAHHGRDISTTDKTVTAVNRPVFSDRLELIKYAIDNQQILSFSYMKYEGDKSRRSIKPIGLKQKGQSLCVEGHCYLRNADRVFAIKRMEGVKIVDSPGKCYDK